MGIASKVINFATDVINHIRLGLPVVSDEVYRERIIICTSCVFFTRHQTCARCSCHMPTKASWPEMSCPCNENNLSREEFSAMHPEGEFVPKWPEVAPLPNPLRD